MLNPFSPILDRVPEERRVGASPGECLGTVWTHVRFLHAALVRAHVVAHAIFPLKALLADGAGVGFLVGVREPVAVEVVDVSEGFATCLAGVVLPHLGGVGGGVLILQRVKNTEGLKKKQTPGLRRIV